MATKRGPYKIGIETRKRVIDAATVAFGKRGYYHATLREIGEQTGISPAAIVQLFGSKQRLFLAVMESWSAHTLDILRGKSFGIEYFTALREAMTYNVQNPGLVELHVALCAEANDPAHPAHEYMVERYRTIIPNVAGHLLEAAATGHIAPLTTERAQTEATHLVSVMDGLQVQWLLLPSLDIERAFNDYIDGMIAKLQTPQPEVARTLGASGGVG